MKKIFKSLLQFSPKTRAVLLFAALLVVVGTGLFYALDALNLNPLTSDAAGNIVVAGIVKDASGSPVSGATVSFVSAGLTGSTTTDMSGKYTLSANPFSFRQVKVTVRASHPQLGTSEASQAYSSRITNYTINLAFTGRLAVIEDVFAIWEQRAATARSIDDYISIVKTIPGLAATVTQSEAGMTLYVYEVATGLPVASIASIH